MTPASATAQEAAPATVEVMVLGVVHFAGSIDLIRPDVPDVLAPDRQAELEALSAALAEWRPTRILVEVERPGPEFEDERYREFTPALLATQRNETVQIAYRLAHRLGHRAVYAFDERSGEGEPDYFPFDRVQAFADANGQSEIIADYMARASTMLADEAALQQNRSIPDILRAKNSAETVRAEHEQFYYGLLRFGDGANQAGAELNALWYMRNAKMFAKIGLIAEPGDRVLVVVGSGHNYWLRHFAEATPGYSFVDPVPWLERAAETAGPRS